MVRKVRTTVSAGLSGFFAPHIARNLAETGAVGGGLGIPNAVEAWRARRDLNPRPQAYEAGDLIGGSIGASKSFQGATPGHPGSPFKYSEEVLSQWEVKVSRVIVESNKLILEFNDQDKLMKFVELLKMLGVPAPSRERRL